MAQTIGVPAPTQARRTPSAPARLSHVGLVGADPRAMATFYQDFLGLEVVGEYAPAHAWFLGGRSDEHHDLGVFRTEQLRHVAFKVASAADLAIYYQNAVAAGMTIKLRTDHGVSMAFYVEDPAGHLIEVCWPTDASAAPKLDSLTEEAFLACLAGPA